MRGWRSLKGGDHVVAQDLGGNRFDAIVCTVPSTWRDRSGSHYTTTRGSFPKAWVRRLDEVEEEATPWPVDDLYWPGQVS